jgi:ketosteroid isomerase-like protein
MTDTALLARIDRLESRFAIAEIVANYCKSCDDRDVPLLRSLFTEDAVIRSRDGVMTSEGLDAVMQMYGGRFAVLGVSAHWTHDHIVRFDDADPNRATGEVFGHAEAHRNGETLVASLRYDDEYRREGGVWKFSSRTLAFLYYVPVGEYAEALGSTDRQRAYGDRRRADYPESFPHWSSWKDDLAAR